MMNYYDSIYGLLSIIMSSGVLFVGLIISFRNKFRHIAQINKGIKSFASSKVSRYSLSSFSALSAVLGGNLGTGNISGMAIALATGGPGSIIWICLAILISSAIKYSGCFMGVSHAKRVHKDSFNGGPMHYFEEVFSNKKTAQVLSFIYCIAILIGALTIGSAIQINSLVISTDTVSFNPVIVATIMLLSVSAVMLGKMDKFATVVSTIVPIMAIFYISSCIFILFEYKENLLKAFYSISSLILGKQAVSGGIAGISLWAVLETGIARGVFASDSGMGLDAIIHSNTRKEENMNITHFARNQGLISVLSSLVVMFVCICTFLVLIVTDVWNIEGLTGTSMCFKAFELAFGLQFGGYIVIVSLFCFAFTTVLTWGFCADRSIEYLSSNPIVMLVWKIIFILIIPFGAFFQTNFAWLAADFTVPLIVIPNIFAIYYGFKASKDALKA